MLRDWLIFIKEWGLNDKKILWARVWARVGQGFVLEFGQGFGQGFVPEFGQGFGQGFVLEFGQGFGQGFVLEFGKALC